MAKILMTCPIFKTQSVKIRDNHQHLRQTSKHEVDYIEVVGASVEHAKQMMYEKFLEGDWDYLFNVDADIKFINCDKNPIDKLIERDKDVVGGLYVYKRFPTQPTHRPLDLQEFYEKKGYFPEKYEFNVPDDIHEVQWLSGGCMMIKREVIEKLKNKYKVPNLPMVYKDEYLSEDFSFCHRARQEGYKIYGDPTIKLGHEGSYLYTFDDYKA